MPAASANSFSIDAKCALVRAGMSITALAGKVGHPRQTVSAVVNGSDRFPLVTQKVRRALKLNSAARPS